MQSMTEGLVEVPMGSSQTDLAMAFLREQDHLIRELIGQIEKEPIARSAFCHRVFQIESNLRTLRSAL